MINQMIREEAGRFIKIAKRIVGETPELWTWKPRARGLDKPLVGHPPGYQAISMIVLCLFKVYSDHSFRWLEGFLKDNQSLRHELGFEDGCPSYERIRRAMPHVDESYLRSLNKKILVEPKKNVGEGVHRRHRGGHQVLRPLALPPHR